MDMLPRQVPPLTQYWKYCERVDPARENRTIPSGFADAAREPQAMRLAQPEEGASRGGGWFLVRAVVLLVTVTLVVGWLIS